MKYIKRITIIIIIYLLFNICNVYAEDLPEKFDLREYIEIEVRDQKETNTCWAFSSTSLLSAHLAYVQDEIYTFSPRHLEYVMSEDSIVGKENPYAYESKILDIGGTEDVFKQYVIQGTGPILEKNMPFENNCEPITEEALPLELQYKQVTEAEHILPMYKEWENGELVYSDYTKNTIDLDEALEYRNSVKKAIKEYGGVEATLAFDIRGFNYLNGSFNTKELTDYWHTILLVGWDDTYSKENFNENVRPLTDGAYIALNSWGPDLGDEGYIYISYEDVSIDVSSKTYIKEIQDVDYDNVYFNDLSVAKQKGETLTEISFMVDSRITGYTYAHLKVDGNYVLTNAFIDDCIENFVLETPIKLTSNTQIELEIAVSDNFKQYIYPYYYTVSNANQFEVGKLSDNTLDGTSNEIYLYTKHNVIDNGNKVEVKLFKDGKDLTSKFDITGNFIDNNQTGISIKSKDAYNGEYTLKLIYNNQEKTYKITVVNGIEEEDRETINDDTTDTNVDKEADKENVTGTENGDRIDSNVGENEEINNSNGMNNIVDEDNQEADKGNINGSVSNNIGNETNDNEANDNETNENATNGNVNAETKEPEKVVLKGDVSLDGKVTITDLSQLKAYMVKLINLPKANLVGCDLNSDGKISILDISILKNTLVNIQ